MKDGPGSFVGIFCLEDSTSNSILSRATLSTAEYPAKNFGEALEKYNNEKNKDSTDEPRDVTFYR